MVHTGRWRGKSRSRILYWFRTPPGVRVGRSALDEDAIRLLEANNPDLEFDWTSILKGQDASPKVQGRTRESAPSNRQQSTGGAPRPRPEPVQPAPLPEQPDRSGSPESAETAQQAGHAEGMDQLEVATWSESIELTEHLEPARAAEPGTPLATSEDLPATAVVARLGAEGVLRLRARHAEVLARISEKITDPVRRDELKAQAERLNPDTWVTDAEVGAGLESYESVFESLRGVVGRRRTRRRPRGGQPGSPGQPVSAGDRAAETGAADDGAAEDGEVPGE